MTVLNPAFEIGGTDASQAASWTLTATTVEEDYAGFVSDVAPSTTPLRGAETFERWDVLADLNNAVEAVWGPAGDTKGVDDFESDWLNNAYDLEFDPTLLAGAAWHTVPQDTEDFEASWDNDAYVTDIAQTVTVVALFDVSPQSFEDFEESWSNDTYFTDISQVVTIAAAFDVTVSEGFEDFEDEWTLTMTTV